jgi:GntR family transcriptional regulator / MocR family aminotransferase
MDIFPDGCVGTEMLDEGSKETALKGRSKRASLAVLSDFVLNPQAPIPLWQQLYQQLRDAMISRRLPPGTQLRATRILAQELGCSRNTVLGAFEQLIAEGYLEGRIGSGTYVANILPDDVMCADDASADQSSRATRRSHCTLGLSQRGSQLARMIQDRVPYKAFAPCRPDVSLFPFEIWEKLARVWGAPSQSLLTQADPCGYWPLRETICTYLRAARMIECKPEQVIITGGAQNGVDMAARLLLDPGDAVWVEDPGYPGLQAAFCAADTTVVPVPVDQEGLSIAEGKATGQVPRMIAVAPSHQYPLGVTMSLQRRLELLSFAAEVDSWIIEDDYDNEFRYEGRPLAALRSLDSDDRVIYVGTFSKVLFPSLRLGYLVVPSRISERFAQARVGIDVQPSLLSQPIVDSFIREGYFFSHVRRMRTIYRDRQAVLVDAAEKNLSGLLHVHPDASGLHLLGRFTPEVSARLDDASASRRAANSRIFAPPLSSFYADRRDRGALVLGYAAVDERSIISATQALSRALRL